MKLYSVACSALKATILQDITQLHQGLNAIYTTFKVYVIALIKQFLSCYVVQKKECGKKKTC